MVWFSNAALSPAPNGATLPRGLSPECHANRGWLAATVKRMEPGTSVPASRQGVCCLGCIMRLQHYAAS
jgi:hypothetical protein